MIETGSARIVLSDDSAEMITLLRLVLEHQGNFTNLVILPEAQAVIDYARAHPVDLIITDVSKPILDGFEMLRQLRQGEETRDIPLIFVTTRNDALSRQTAEELGANALIPKPFLPQDLLKTVRHILGAQ